MNGAHVQIDCACFWLSVQVRPQDPQARSWWLRVVLSIFALWLQRGNCSMLRWSCLRLWRVEIRGNWLWLHLFRVLCFVLQVKQLWTLQASDTSHFWRMPEPVGDMHQEAKECSLWCSFHASSIVFACLYHTFHRSFSPPTLIAFISQGHELAAGAGNEGCLQRNRWYARKCAGGGFVWLWDSSEPGNKFTHKHNMYI